MFTDNKINENGQSSLSTNALFRTLISPIYLHEWVCSFAFDNIAISSFHTDHVVPTTAFSNLLLLSFHSRFQHLYVSNLFYHQFEGYVGFLPVHERDNITVAYAIHVGSDSKNYVNSHDRPPFAPPYITRFVVNHTTDTLLAINPCVNYHFIAIHAVNFRKDINCTFIMPLKDYNWDNLPDNPPVVLKGRFTSLSTENLDEMVSMFDKSQSQEIRVNDIDITPADIQELMSKASISPKNQSSSTSQTNKSNPDVMTTFQQTDSTDFCTDIIPIIRKAETLPYISDKQDYNFRTAILQKLLNRAFIPGERIDSCDFVLPGYDSLMNLRNFHHMFDIPDNETCRKTGLQFASLYYFSVLSFKIDKRILQNVDPEEKDAKQITTKKQDRETMLRKRRERNRLSAQRSNCRNKEYEEAMKLELAMSKPLINLLREMKDDLSRKNERLKTIMNCTSDPWCNT